MARSHPPVVFGAGTVQPDQTVIDADLERLKARSGVWHVVASGSCLPCQILRSTSYRAARFHTDIKPAVAVSAKKSKPVIGADFDLLTQVHCLPG